MSTKEFLATLSNTMKESMVTKDRTMTSITRIVKTEITKASKDKGVDESEVDFLPVLKSTKKKLIEEIESLEKASRDCGEQKRQLEWVESFIPSPMTEEEAKNTVEAYLSNGGNKDMKGMIGCLKEAFGDRFDGKIASQIAKTLMEK